jgi:hypothetical protein
MTLSMGILLTLFGLQVKPQPLLVVLCSCALAGLSVASDHRALLQDSTVYNLLLVAAVVGLVYGARRNREGGS